MQIMSFVLENNQESQKVLSKIVAKAWLDEGFKKRLISDTVTVLEENGLMLPSGAQARINENTSLSTLTSTDVNLSTDGVYEIPLPPKPSALTDELIGFSADKGDTESLPALKSI